MRRTLLLLCLLPLLLFAQRYTVSDTLWVDADMNDVARDQATRYGIVRRIDTTSNVAIIHYFDRETQHLESIQRVVAEGDGAGLAKGKQIFFGADGKVTVMKIFTIVHESRSGRVRNRLANETFLYPDGKTHEEVNISFGEKPNGLETKSYVRKIYYPDGSLQYEETMNEKGEQTTVYYKPNGKKDKRPKERFDMYMTMPEFPGGQLALFQFLSQNVKYPPIAQENGIEGRVIVQFVVAKDGKISDVEVVRSGGDPSLDREALRVIKAMPRWIPGTQRGKPVRVKYTVPVNFRLQ